MAMENDFRGLCVGGPLDGRDAISSEDVMRARDADGRGFSYERHVMRFAMAGNCYFWVPVGQTQGWLLQKLVEVYRRHRFGEPAIPVRVRNGRKSIGVRR